MSFLQTIYVACYLFSKKNETDSPKQAIVMYSTIGFFGLITINLLSFLAWMDIFFDIYSQNLFANYRITIFSIATISVFSISLLFNKTNFVKESISIAEKEHLKKKSKVFVIIYIIVSVLFLLSSAVYKIV